MGSLLSFSQIMCTAETSALTTTIVGQMKMVISTMAAYVIFGGRPSLLTVSGMTITALGGVTYSLSA
jgi:hypothetical protein